ncbi:MAG: hypothetical protein H0X33_02415 [Taibaiella sp.]|nr:hypothetical protein [Taibaiella sp.]
MGSGAIAKEDQQALHVMSFSDNYSCYPQKGKEKFKKIHEMWIAREESLCPQPYCKIKYGNLRPKKVIKGKESAILLPFYYHKGNIPRDETRLPLLANH